VVRLSSLVRTLASAEKAGLELAAKLPLQRASLPECAGATLVKLPVVIVRRQQRKRAPAAGAMSNLAVTGFGRVFARCDF